MSVASPASHISFLSPPASEQGSESSLEDGQAGSKRQKERAFSSRKIEGWEWKGRGKKMGKARARFPGGLPQESPSHPL